jgi:hypothetical protein
MLDLIVYFIFLLAIATVCFFYMQSICHNNSLMYIPKTLKKQSFIITMEAHSEEYCIIVKRSFLGITINTPYYQKSFENGKFLKYEAKSFFDYEDAKTVAYKLSSEAIDQDAEIHFNISNRSVRFDLNASIYK